jgi:hypothetical protein
MSEPFEAQDELKAPTPYGKPAGGGELGRLGPIRSA